MNNQTLAILGLAPMGLLVLSGALGLHLEEGTTTLLGIVLCIFGVWGLIRLYKIK